MIQTNNDVSACSRQPRRAASMAAMSIFLIVIIASKARFASPPAASASVSARGVICQERPQRSLHQPQRHRRLMLIATCVLMGAEFGRMPIMHSPLYFYGGVDGLILLGALRDLAVSRRIHTVYLIAIPLLVAGQMAVAQIFLHRSSLWIRIAHRLLG